MMDRRRFLGTAPLAAAGLSGITLPALLAAGPARAQQPRRFTIGILAIADSAIARRAIEAALEKRWPGSAAASTFLERNSGGNLAALPGLARELVEARVDLIVARLTPSARAARDATATIPIVAVVGAAVEGGIAASLAQPGRNITGVSSLTPETTGKLVEIAREFFPGAARFGFLSNATDPLTPVLVEHVNDAARQAGRAVQVEAVTGTTNLAEAIERLVAAKAVATILQPSLPAAASIQRAHAAGLPVLGAVRSSIESGALASYAPPPSEVFGLMGEMTVQVLEGAKPADLPIRQPTRFELVINLKVAKQLGLSLPPLALARADEVIE